MTNMQILKDECDLRGFEYDGGNLMTYKQWAKVGYQVQKGEKAFVSTNLWISTTKKNKETGEKEKSFISKKTNLFTLEQVKAVA